MTFPESLNMRRHDGCRYRGEGSSAQAGGRGGGLAKKSDLVEHGGAAAPSIRTAGASGEFDSMASIRIVTAALLALCIAAPAALAQETERSRPWIALSGHNAGAAGTCPDVDGGEGDTCYIVRCEAKSGPVFVIQSSGGAEADVRSVRIGIGKYKAVIKLEKAGAGERLARFSDHPRLLKALTSGRPWADLETVDAPFHYTTQFELTDAKARIARVLKRCPL